MRIQLLFSFFILISAPLISQTLNELSQSNEGYKKDVKALVIGISDYQNIRSLNYAHRDAEEFAKFLQDNPFWNVEEGNIFLFTNENARQGDILMGLQWLMETTTEEQEVIFYFSGHGDVENVDGQDQGFLLAHDAPKNNYAMGGTIAVSMLDSAFTELIRRNVKINIIVDACKSGQLAGGMTGTGHTNETLAAKWTSQTRILSAQPNQLSLEDEKWGDGRGVFSYFLIRGMSGYANADNDELIRLNEIENYLGENLAKQTLGAQQPIVDGPNKWTKNFSVKDTVQMALYEDDEVESELTNLVASTKAGEDQVTESCKALYGTTQEKIKAFNRDAFLEITADYAALMACSGDQYASLRYEYMRQLINQINSIVRETLSGKKLGVVNDYAYGIALIQELLEINSGKKLIGREHFENLYTFFKAMHYMYGEEAAWTEHDFLVTFKGFTWDIDQLRMKAYNTTSTGNFIGFIFNSPTNIEELKKTKDEQVVKWNATEYDTYQFLKAVDDDLFGPVEVELLFFDDTIKWIEKAEIGEKVKRLVSNKDQEGYYENILIEQLKEAVAKEPDAAYLKYPLSYMYNAMDEREKAYANLLSAIDESPKWLTPKYVLATMYHNDGEYELARKYYEEVLELDSIYQDFECLDCFYMGLISLYQQTGETDRMNEAVELWNNVKQAKPFDLYDEMLYYSYEHSDRKGMEHWLDLMHENSKGSFQEQMELIASELYMFRADKKYNEEVRDYLADLLELRVEGKLEDFFKDTDSSTVRYLVNDLYAQYSEPWDRIPFDIEDTLTFEEFNSYDFFYEVSRVFAALAASKKSNPDDLYFLFFVEGAIKYHDLKSFDDWLLTFELINEIDLIRENWEFEKEVYYDPETAFDENFMYPWSIGYTDLAQCFDYDDAYNTQQLTIKLLEGDNVVDDPAFKQFITAHSNTYEDELLAKQIIQKLKRYEINKGSQAKTNSYDVQMKLLADRMKHYKQSKKTLESIRGMLLELLVIRKDGRISDVFEEQDDYGERSELPWIFYEFFDERDEIPFHHKDSLSLQDFKNGLFLTAIADVFENIEASDLGYVDDATLAYALRGATMFNDLSAFHAWLEALGKLKQKYSLDEVWGYMKEDYQKGDVEFQDLFFQSKKSDLLLSDVLNEEDLSDNERLTVMLFNGEDITKDPKVKALLEQPVKTVKQQTLLTAIHAELASWISK